MATQTKSKTVPEKTTRGPVDKSDWPNATYAEKPALPPRLEQFVHRVIDADLTGAIEGPPGGGKTQTMKSMFAEAFPHLRVVYMNGPNTTPEDITMDTPKQVHGEDGKRIELSPSLLDDLGAKYLPDGSLQPYVLVIDDPNQAGKHAQNTLMQITNDKSVNSFDLKANGCVGVFVLNNDSLADTGALTTDLAALDRLVTLTVGFQDTGWRWALAQKYREHDLTDVFRTWADMPKEIRNDLSPRVLDHVIEVLLLGYPGIVGLPLKPDGTRRRLVATDGDTKDDRTAEVISRIAAALGAPNPEKVDNIVTKAVTDAIRRGFTILIQGPPGGGKTALTMDTILKEIGGNPRDYYFSVPTTDPERFSLPLPAGDVIQQILTKPFMTNEPKVIVLDEANRGGPAVQARIMELNQEHTLAGQEVPGLRAVINIENPPYVMGRKMSVNRRNRAQTERFTINLQLNELDIDSDEWLLTVFPTKWADTVERKMRLRGTLPESADELDLVKKASTEQAHQMAETVLDWWKTDLDDEGRQWVSSRGRERMMRYLLVSGDPDEAIISLGHGERAPVGTASLRARLAERPLTGLQEIVLNLDEWVERLRAAQSGDAVHGGEDTAMVQRALANAALSQLQEHRPTVITLLKYLPTKYRQANLEGPADRMVFWAQALKEMAAELRAEQGEALTA